MTKETFCFQEALYRAIKTPVKRRDWEFHRLTFDRDNREFVLESSFTGVGWNRSKRTTFPTSEEILAVDWIEA